MQEPAEKKQLTLLTFIQVNYRHLHIAFFFQIRHQVTLLKVKIISTLVSNTFKFSKKPDPHEVKEYGVVVADPGTNL